MRELMILAAAATSFEDLLEQLTDHINEYNITPNTDLKNKIATICLLITMNMSTGGDMKKAVGLIKNLDEIEARNKIFTTEKN